MAASAAARAMDAAVDEPGRGRAARPGGDRTTRAATLLDEAARACGSRPFATGGRLDRARRDLELFLLQHRLDPVLAARRRRRARRPSGPVTLDDRRRDFEARYRADPDPWRYRSSAYERAKYAATLAACGPGPFARALELGGSIGVFSALLAPRCRRADDDRLLADRGRRGPRAARWPRARPRGLLGRDPGDAPAGPLRPGGGLGDPLLPEPARWRRRWTLLEQQLVAGGRLVCVHWRPPGPERPLTAAQVHARCAAQPWLRRLRSAPHRRVPARRAGAHDERAVRAADRRRRPGRAVGRPRLPRRRRRRARWRSSPTSSACPTAGRR